MGYPDRGDEVVILMNARMQASTDSLEPVISLKEMADLQEEVQSVFVDESIARYIVDLMTKTRNDKRVYLGVSPRGSIALMRASQAWAFIHGRNYCLPDDVQHLIPYVCSHRIIMKSEALYEGIDAGAVLNEIMAKTPVPVQRQVN